MFGILGALAATWARGNNADHQLGLATAQNYSEFTQIDKIQFTQVAAFARGTVGLHNNQVYSTGANVQGELGSSESTISTPAAAPAYEGRNILSVSAGNSHLAALA